VHGEEGGEAGKARVDGGYGGGAAHGEDDKEDPTQEEDDGGHAFALSCDESRDMVTLS
jgi:hypothetical protein